MAQVLLAWEEPDVLYQGLARARFTAAMLAQVRHRGWAQGSGGPAVDAATLAVPVRGPGGRVVAALSLSGPRTGPRVREFTATMIDAAMRLGEACDG